MDTTETVVHAGQPKTYRPGGFWAFVTTQFQGALNDNLYKSILMFFLAAVLQIEEGHVVAITTVLMALPFILFPGFFGALSDRYSKKDIAIWVKYLEFVIVTIGAAGFFFHSPYILYTVMFLMGAHSAMFGPAKYGILPETLPEERLSWSNGIVQMTTMLSVIAGQILAGVLFDLLGVNRSYLVGFGLMGLTCIGIVTAWRITRPEPANPAQSFPINPWKGMGRDLGIIWRNRWLRMIAFGYTYFWFAGAMLIGAVVDWKSVLLLSATQVAVLSGLLSLGIGLGALTAGLASRGKIEMGLVPIGAGIMGIGCILAYWFAWSYSSAVAFAFIIGFGGGFFDVPLAAGLQYLSPKQSRGGVMAAANMLTWIGILIGGGLYFLRPTLGVSVHAVFLAVGISTLAVLTIVCALTPIIAIRSVLWLLANTVYRLNVRGRVNIPEDGGALLVANHVSFIDALVVSAAIDRPVRFIMHDEIYQTWWIRPIAHMMGAIPISAMGGPRELVQSMRTATEAIRTGEIVCIFAEGQISRTGQMLPFRKGFERIMKDVEAPIIPVQLDRLWGSIWSFDKGRFFWKAPRRIPYHVTISFGKPLPHDADSVAVRDAIMDLGTEAWIARKLDQPLLHRAFIRTMRAHPFAMALADGRTPKLSFLMSYVGAIAIGRKLKKILGPEPMTGILLPQSVGGAVTNIALQIMGKVAVNLNYTASNESVASAARQCGITHVLTAKEFLQKVPMEVPGTTVLLDDVKKSITSSDKIVAILLAVFCPMRVVEKALGSPTGRTEDDLCTVIFSSGSEGEPKGVMLSHKNVLTNCEAVAQVFPHETGDGFMGILPFFHSFGFMGTLWLPLWRGFFTVYHPNPLEPKIIGQLIFRYRPRFLIATPTFLQGFIRRCLPEELSSLEYVITGAEKLPQRVREAFLAKFGVEPLEGYGTTECAPAVSVNVPDFRAPGFYQVGTKHGTIGQTLPGVSVRVVDPDTSVRVPHGGSGLLLVKGPNIMKGYLGQPEKTAIVLQDGWYNTGDIAAIDEEGFITITDRLARFSKIAGEMVPHTKVEETLHKLLDMNDQTFAVTSVPDEQKGERLIVLHTLMDGELEVLVDKLKDSELPNLWRPKPTSFYRIAEIPLLGTGKMDLKKIKTLAKEMDVGE
ncbi:MAG: acyl-[ACP]--phospholipid O-acyltransferase [Candidatus Hydrogenedentes bacterium]|nr:acyl-[ACP]--phospholipid O-acyltransferase [Candidatus Hydrogenedentota bacterium]